MSQCSRCLRLWQQTMHLPLGNRPAGFKNVHTCSVYIVFEFQQVIIFKIWQNLPLFAYEVVAYLLHLVNDFAPTIELRR